MRWGLVPATESNPTMARPVGVVTSSAWVSDTKRHQFRQLLQGYDQIDE
jgi:hypothetical protein